MAGPVVARVGGGGDTKQVVWRRGWRRWVRGWLAPEKRNDQLDGSFTSLDLEKKKRGR